MAFEVLRGVNRCCLLTVSLLLGSLAPQSRHLEMSMEFDFLEP
jgi:hypothetical protein